MKKITQIKLYFNEATGQFQEQEIPGAPFIEAQKEIEVVREKLAVIRNSVAVSIQLRLKWHAAAKSLGCTSCCFLGKTITEPLPIDSEKVLREVNKEFNPTTDGGYDPNYLNFINTEKYEVMCFVDIPRITHITKPHYNITILD